MQFKIERPDFKTVQLAVETAGLLNTPRLLVNGAVAAGQKGHYAVASDSGAATMIELKKSFLDPVPQMKIGGERVALARAFKWYEYVWFGFIVLALYQVTAVGGLVGAIAAVISTRVLRGDHSTLKKVGLLTLIFIGASVVVLAIMVIFTLVTGHPLQ